MSKTKTAKEPRPVPKLRAWNELVEEVQLPNDFALAFMSGRPELLKIVHRPLEAEETRMVAHAMGVLLQTNVELQRHAADLAELVEQLYGHLKGMSAKVAELDDHANFRTPLADYDADGGLA